MRIRAAWDHDSHVRNSLVISFAEGSMTEEEFLIKNTNQKNKGIN